MLGVNNPSKRKNAAYLIVLFAATGCCVCLRILYAGSWQPSGGIAIREGPNPPGDVMFLVEPCIE